MILNPTNEMQFIRKAERHFADISPNRSTVKAAFAAPYKVFDIGLYLDYRVSGILWQVNIET